MGDKLYIDINNKIGSRLNLIIQKIIDKKGGNLDQYTQLLLLKIKRLKDFRINGNKNIIFTFFE